MSIVRSSLYNQNFQKHQLWVAVDRAYLHGNMLCATTAIQRYLKNRTELQLKFISVTIFIAFVQADLQNNLLNSRDIVSSSPTKYLEWVLDARSVPVTGARTPELCLDACCVALLLLCPFSSLARCSMSLFFCCASLDQALQKTI